MNEIFSYDGEDEANFYEHPDLSDVPASMEEALAASRGGDPIEWMPEAEKLMQNFTETIANGESVVMISSSPETEGVFAGYYSVKIQIIDMTGENVELVERVVYATFEQVAMGHMIVPKEGLFCTDPEY